MPTHRMIVETSSVLSDRCDLCDLGPGSWEYQARGEIERVIRDNHTIADRWHESKYTICHVCAIHVEAKDNMRLLRRMNDGRKDLPVTRRNALMITSFLQQLLPGRQRIGAEFA